MVEDQYKEACLQLAKYLIGNSMSAFPSLLDENVTLAIFNEKVYDKVCGKACVLNYWNDWVHRAMESMMLQYRVVGSYFVEPNVLQIVCYDRDNRNCNTIMVEFSFNNEGNVSFIILSDEYRYYTHFVSGHHGLLPMLENLSLNMLSVQSITNEGARLCPNCGREQPIRIWYIKNGTKQSICPECGGLVETRETEHRHIDYSKNISACIDNAEYIQAKQNNRSPARAQFFEVYGKDAPVKNAISYYCNMIVENSNKNMKEDGVVAALQEAYYNLGVIYYREFGTGIDLLRSYAYLNECPIQNDKVRNLKASICNKIVKTQDFDHIHGGQILEDYDDLPF